MLKVLHLFGLQELNQIPSIVIHITQLQQQTKILINVTKHKIKEEKELPLLYLFPQLYYNKKWIFLSISLLCNPLFPRLVYFWC